MQDTVTVCSDEVYFEASLTQVLLERVRCSLFGGFIFFRSASRGCILRFCPGSKFDAASRLRILAALVNFGAVAWPRILVTLTDFGAAVVLREILAALVRQIGTAVRHFDICLEETRRKPMKNDKADARMCFEASAWLPWRETSLAPTPGKAEARLAFRGKEKPCREI